MSASEEPRADEPGEESVTSFIDSLDSLSFPARMRAVSEHARALSPDDYAALHRALDRGNTDRRHLGLQSAVARRDLSAIERALTDPILRRRALSAAIRLPVSDAVLTSVVTTASRRDRVAAYGVLRLSRRRALADELVPLVRERFGRAELAELLAACSASVVDRWLPEVEPSSGLLRRLARTAPEPVARFLAAEIARREGREQISWLRNRSSALLVLATRYPSVLAEASAQHGAAVRALLHVDADAYLGALLTRPTLLIRELHRGEPVSARSLLLSRASRAAIAALPAMEVAALLRLFRNGSTRASVLAAVAQQNRRKCFALVYPEGEFHASNRSEELRTLPKVDRVELAEQLLAANTDVVNRGWYRLDIASALPYDRAEPSLRTATTSHRYQQRRAAWTALLRCAATDGDPQVFASAVHSADRAWHDQDRIRSAVLQVLAEAPARLSAEISVRVFWDAVTATVGARDAAPRTCDLLARWLTRSLAGAVARGQAGRVVELSRLLARVYADERTSGEFPVDVALSAGAAARLWSAIREQALASALAGHFALTLRMARLFRRRLATVPELDALVGDIARTASDPADREAAARLWVGVAGLREQRVGELVAHDPRLGLVDRAWEIVVRRRTDLLHRVLATSTTLPPVPAGCRGRWTAAQRSSIEARALSVVGNPAAGIRERAAAVGLVSEGAALLSIVDSMPQPIAAAALEALGGSVPARMRSDQVLPALLRQAAAASGPAPRAAVRALAVAVDGLPGNMAVDLLRPVVTDRGGSLGAAKESVRVLGVRQPVGALDLLVEMWIDPRLHHDLRAATAVALAGYLGASEQIPALLIDAIRGPAAVRTAVLSYGAESFTAGRQRLWAGVLAETVDGLSPTDDPALSCEVVSAYDRCWQTRPHAVDRLSRLVGADSHGEVAEAAWRLAVRSRRQVAVVSIIDRLTSDIDSPDPEVASTAWHRLRNMARIPVWDRINTDRQTVRVLIEGCRSVAMHTSAVELSARLAADSLSGPPDPIAWDELIAIIDDRPARWPGEVTEWTGYVSADLDTVRVIARHLLSLAGSVPAQLAVGVVAIGAKHAGFTAEWIELLDDLARHRDPDVREAARSVRRLRSRIR